MLERRLARAMLWVIAVSLVIVWSGAGHAAPEKILRIGTGGTGGTYFPIGSLIAQVTTDNRALGGDGDNAGVKGLLTVAQISSGSVSNIEALRRGQLDLALVQADIAYWAYHGVGVYADAQPFEELRVIANLYPESMHLVARLGSGIQSVADLAGKRVSLDEPGSGTVIDAQLILEAHGLRTQDFLPRYMKPHFAARAIIENQLDAFFVFAGYPAKTILELSVAPGATLVPIAGPQVDELLAAHPYFGTGVIPTGTYGRGLIPAGTYPGVGDTPTITVGAQLVARARLDAGLISAFTEALWSKSGLKTLQSGHAKGKEIRREHALMGVSVPLHEGAKAFYAREGMLRPEGSATQ